MKKISAWIASIPLLVIIGIVLWLFTDIVAYILIAAALSFVGHPLVKLIDSIRIGRFRLPHTLSSTLALLLMLAILASAVWFITPIISGQAKAISQIDYVALNTGIQKSLIPLESHLYRLDMLEPGETISQMVIERLLSLTQAVDVGKIMNSLMGVAGKVFIGLFSVLFMTFFFLKDDKLFVKGFIFLFPEKYGATIEAALSDILRLLSRYFVGLSIEVITMMILISTGGWILGLENALIIGVIGGLLNVIPYLGPMFGAAIGATLVITTNIAPDNVQPAVMLAGGILVVFLVANLIDNLVLQPFIYSNSVRAHPLEIFLVIMMAGSLAGVAGMILAIPTYTIFRVIGRQFFNQYRIIRKISEER